MPEAVIVAATRTPIGRANKGSLVDCRPDDLSSTVIKAVLAKVPELDPATVEDVLWGCGQPAGESGYNVARVVAILAGIAQAPGVTVNRYCSSSFQTIRMAAHAIKAGEGDVFVAGGVETVSRFAKGMSDGLPGTHNSLFADAEARSAKRHEGAKARGRLRRVCPTCTSRWVRPRRMSRSSRRLRAPTWTSSPRSRRTVPSKRRRTASSNGRSRRSPPSDGTVVTTDDGPRPDTTVEKLSQLQPVFRPDGTVTAGNACPLNDGAAATIVMSDTRAKQLGIKPLARIVASGVTAVDPEIMGLGPVGASKQALERAGLTIDQIDLVEINEAFAAQVIPSAKQLGVPWDKLNVNGGAIALGHPFGMTGARIMATLLNGLEDRGLRYGLETMCVGGGQGMAMIVERLT